MILTLLWPLLNGTYLLVGLSHGFVATDAEIAECGGSLVMTVFSMRSFILALITTHSGVGYISCKEEVAYFLPISYVPIFMMTYNSYYCCGFVQKVEWVPTKH